MNFDNNQGNNSFKNTSNTLNLISNEEKLKTINDKKPTSSSNNNLYSTNQQQNIQSNNLTNSKIEEKPKSGYSGESSAKINIDGSGNIKADIKVKPEDAIKFGQENKHLLPSKEQVIEGAKTTQNVVKNSGVLDDVQPSQPKKKDPLTALFGLKK